MTNLASEYKFLTRTELDKQRKQNALNYLQDHLLEKDYVIFHTDLSGLEEDINGGYWLITDKKLLHHDQDCDQTFSCDREKNCSYSGDQCFGIFVTSESKRLWIEKSSCQQNREEKKQFKESNAKTIRWTLVATLVLIMYFVLVHA